MTEKEIKALDLFEKEHINCCDNNIGKTSFVIVREFTKDGSFTTITCNNCHKSKDITDYSKK